VLPDAEKSICAHFEVASLYTEYFNYTLKDALRGGRALEEGELWLLLFQLLELVVALKESKLAIQLDLNSVFLTLKGQPAVYIHSLLSF
jgi:hypothetical protein